MFHKTKIFISVAAAICIVLLFYVTKFITDRSYRRQLPTAPVATYSKAIREQIMYARRKTEWFTSAGTIGELGMAYHSCADYGSAAKCYQLADEKDSQQWIWNYYLGYLNMEQGQTKAAIENFTQVVKKNAKNYFALYYTGEAYRTLGLNDTAEGIFRIIINSISRNGDDNTYRRECFFPLKTYALFQLARLYANTNRSDSAGIVLQSIIVEQATFGPAYRALAAIYNAAGDTTIGKEYVARANDLLDFVPPADSLIDEIALESRSDQYLLKQIEDAVRSGNHHWALTLCNHALKYFPDNKALVSNAVFENFRQGFDDKALLYLDKHFKYFSNDAEELMNVTDLLYNRQHLAEAIKYFNQLKQLITQNSTLAMWLYERGKKDEAIAMMAELIKQHPSDEKIIADEIRLLLDMGEDEKANKYFLALKQQSPAGTETLRVKGMIYEKKGITDSAGIAYESAYATDPKDLPFTRKLIEFYIAQKNWQQAISHFRAALELHPNEPFLLEGIGRLLIACPDAGIKNIPEGIAFSQRAFINSQSPYQTRLSAGKNLATAYLSLGDKKNTTKYINKTIKLADEGNQSVEYIAYFRKLISK